MSERIVHKMGSIYVKDYPDPKISKMTPEELDAFIEAEKERCEKMTDWSEAWAEITEWKPNSKKSKRRNSL